MRTIIAGTRRTWSLSLVRQAIAECGFPVTLIISGGASGVDTAAIDIALIDGYAYEVYEADWDRYGDKAGTIRNNVMADSPAEALIALPDSRSIGTRHMIRVMRDLQLPVYVKELS